MHVSTANAFWIVEPGRGEIRQEPLPRPAADEVLVRALYSGVSRGTETLVHEGRVPPSEAARMRAPHQAGEFPGPVKYGYCSVGVVESGPDALLGRSVFCLYPHQDRYVVSATDVVPLPPEVPPERAVLAANMETAVNGVWDAAPSVGDRVAVVGAGVVGLLTAWLCSQMPGVRVDLLDIDRRKARPAEALGLNCRHPDAADPDNDLVIHASGQADGLRRALELAGNEATIIELSWFGTREVGLPLGEAFHSRRLTLRSSQVGQLPAQHRPRWDHRRRLELALGLLADRRLDAMISGESPFTDMPELMSNLVRDGRDTLCHRLRY